MANLDSFYKPTVGGLQFYGVEQFYQITEPTQRVDNTPLVIGDRWYKTDDGTNYYWDGAAWVDSVGGGGGLVHFVETENTTTPNSTTNPTQALVATNAAAINIDAAIVPKGDGSFSLAIPDGAVAGGRKRGAYSVDLQLSRTSSLEITSSSYSFIGAGYRNTVIGTYSAVVGGSVNTVTGSSSFCTGSFNTVSGTYSFASGLNNTVDASYARCGGYYADTQNRYGTDVWANGRESVDGDSQILRVVHRNRTTDATPTALTADSINVASTSTTFALQPYSVQSIVLDLTAIQQSSTNVGAWRIQFTVARGSTAATTTIKGVPSVVEVVNDLGVTVDSSIVKVNTTNGNAYLEVTGLAATNIQWVAGVINITENKY